MNPGEWINTRPHFKPAKQRTNQGHSHSISHQVFREPYGKLVIRVQQKAASPKSHTTEIERTSSAPARTK